MTWFRRKKSPSIIFAQVCEDLLDRDEKMRKKHGRKMTMWRYEKPLREAYEEALDICVYLRAELGRREQ